MAPYGGIPKPMGIELSSRKRKGKSPYGVNSKKGKYVSKKITFQKKLVVLRYMGEGKKQFTLKESSVILRGLLPEIDVESNERDVRDAIVNVIVNSDQEMTACSRYSFEFIEASGKSLCVPAKPSSFEWTGRAVKNLAGSGQVYVRLLFDLVSSDSESEFPDVFPSRPTSPPNRALSSELVQQKLTPTTESTVGVYQEVLYRACEK